MLLMRRSRPKIAWGPPLPVVGTMLTHPGCVRELNEDAVAYVLPPADRHTASHGALALVADGMGGHAAGEVASRIAANTIRRLYYQKKGSPPAVLAACFTAANTAIQERSRSDPSCAGMGTTCTALAFQGNTVYLAHIGDSRAYLLRDGELRQISEDHSLVAQLVRDGAMTEEEAALSPERNVILRCLGTEREAKPSISGRGIPLRIGDAFLLCSDGLSDLVDDTVIAETVARLPPFEACRALVDAALAAGGTDNVSVGIFVVGGCQPQRAAPGTTRPIDLPEDDP
jgi:serine/threonine protein phosphatase PrpC